MAEVLLGLIEVDKRSWLNVDSEWKPTMPQAGEKFVLAENAAILRPRTTSPADYPVQQLRGILDPPRAATLALGGSDTPGRAVSARWQGCRQTSQRCSGSVGVMPARPSGIGVAQLVRGDPQRVAGGGEQPGGCRGFVESAPDPGCADAGAAQT